MSRVDDRVLRQARNDYRWYNVIIPNLFGGETFYGVHKNAVNNFLNIIDFKVQSLSVDDIY